MIAYATSGVEVTSSGGNSMTDWYNAFSTLVIGSPHLLLISIMAHISGHTWTYIILSYFSKKERNILVSWIGKEALGIIWFTLVLIPTYLITYKSIYVKLYKIKNITATTIVISLAIQAILFIIITYRKRKKG